MAKKKILVVEDEVDMLTMLSLELEGAGYQVFQAKDGVEGFEVAEAKKPDLIISDVLMPNMDGNALRKKLQSSDFGKNIPFIVLTARGNMKDYFEVVEVDDFISKPFEPEDLLGRVEHVLNRPKIVIKKSKKKVLVGAADDTVTVKIVTELNKAGCKMDYATSGADMISKVVQFQPDVILIDVQMEGMSSQEIISVLRQMPQSEKTPILGFSFYRVSELGSEDIRQKALSIDGSQSNCKEAGMTDYLGRFVELQFLKSMEKYL